MGVEKFDMEREELKTKRSIPLSVPNLRGNELKYVQKAIETEWVSTGGPYINDFENNIAEYVNVKGAVACQSGTSGIHIALEVCGVTKENEVIVPTLTFIAAINPVKYIGAEPVFMDCDDSLTIDSEKLLSYCQNECIVVDGRLINKSTQKCIKALIVVHVFGNMADMEAIMNIANMYNLTVIEDATEALGTYYTSGRYEGKYAGTIGNIGVYSFNGNKIITTGGGGMIVSDNEALLQKARHLTTQAKTDEVYFIHDEVGYNYRMTNMQAALGLAQLEQLEDFIQIKKKNYDLYKTLISDISGLSLLDYRSDIRCNRWFYSLYYTDEYPVSRDSIIRHMASEGVQTRPIWGLIHTQKPYQSCQTYRIEKALYYLDHIINIPCSTNLDEDNLSYVVKCLRSIENIFKER